ncbi:hypothetical protein AAG906_020782 [Vitis piasezkii]
MHRVCHRQGTRVPPSVHRTCKAQGACHYEFRARATAHAVRAPCVPSSIAAHAIIHAPRVPPSEEPPCHRPCTAHASAGRMPLRVQGACHRAYKACAIAHAVRAPCVPSSCVAHARSVPRVPPSRKLRVPPSCTAHAKRKDACHYEFRACATAHAIMHHVRHRASSRMPSSAPCVPPSGTAHATVRAPHANTGRMPLRVQGACHRASRSVHRACHCLCARMPSSVRRVCHRQERACHRPCTAHAKRRAHATRVQGACHAHTKACATAHAVRAPCVPSSCARMRIRAPRVPPSKAARATVMHRTCKRRAHATTSSGRVPPRMRSVHRVRHRRASRMPSSAPRVPPSGTGVPPSVHRTCKTGRMPLRVQGACHRACGPCTVRAIVCRRACHHPSRVCHRQEPRVPPSVHRSCKRRAHATTSSGRMPPPIQRRVPPRMHGPCTMRAIVMRAHARSVPRVPPSRKLRVPPSCTAHASAGRMPLRVEGRVPPRMHDPCTVCAIASSRMPSSAPRVPPSERACHRPCTAHARHRAHALRVQGACHRACTVRAPCVPSSSRRACHHPCAACATVRNARATVRAPLMQAQGACHYEFRAHATAHTKACATAHAVRAPCVPSSCARMRDPCTACSTVEELLVPPCTAHAKRRRMPLRVQGVCRCACGPCTVCAIVVAHAIIHAPRVPPSEEPRVPPSVHRTCKAQGRMPLRVQGRVPPRMPVHAPFVPCHRYTRKAQGACHDKCKD